MNWSKSPDLDKVGFTVARVVGCLWAGGGLGSVLDSGGLGIFRGDGLGGIDCSDTCIGGRLGRLTTLVDGLLLRMRAPRLNTLKALLASSSSSWSLFKDGGWGVNVGRTVASRNGCDLPNNALPLVLVGVLG